MKPVFLSYRNTKAFSLIEVVGENKNICFKFEQQLNAPPPIDLTEFEMKTFSIDRQFSNEPLPKPPIISVTEEPILTMFMLLLFLKVPSVLSGPFM